jgi:phosphoribosylaminoimidazolecarboxamide formyltransferase/IMP cyclohydrolase
MRLLRMTNRALNQSVTFRSALGGLLTQEVDLGDPSEARAWEVVTEREPTDREMADLRFAWRACQPVKSNAIVLAKSDGDLYFTVGIGGGQPNRVDCVRIAGARAGNRAPGCVMASDAFFPFPDGVEAAADLGVTAVVQPGGSLRDQEAIKAANAAGLSMIFTGVRHFRH